MPEFDVITDLGIELKREIPKGEARLKWLRSAGGYREAVGALRRAGYVDNLLARAINDLSYGEIRLPLKIERPLDL